MAGVT